MSRARIAYWALFAVTLAVYAAMAGGTLPAIARDAAGLTAFDMRPAGYTPAEARAFLTALGDEGRALYLGPQHLLDLIYPALLAAVLIGALWVLLPPLWLRGSLILAALAGMAADYTENARVAAMLVHTGPVPDAMVAAASRASQTKSMLTSVAMLAIVAGLLRAAWIKWRAR